jgi:hypothetical protein
VRTNLTLDDVVAALRRGFESLLRPALKPAPYRLRPWNLGGSRVGSLDNIEVVLSRVEGETHR